MEFFRVCGILGICLAMLGKLQLSSSKKNLDSKEAKFKNKILTYMKSDLVGEINFKYGALLVVVSALGVALYNSIALHVVVVMILGVYFVKVLTKGYKFCTEK